MSNKDTNSNRPTSYHHEEESDAKKLADKHLADPKHVITEEDMRNIQVGVTGEADAPTEQAIEDAGNRIADDKSDKESDAVPGAQKATPWDVIDS